MMERYSIRRREQDAPRTQNAFWSINLASSDYPVSSYHTKATVPLVAMGPTVGDGGLPMLSRVREDRCAGGRVREQYRRTGLGCQGEGLVYAFRIRRARECYSGRFYL